MRQGRRRGSSGGYRLRGSNVVVCLRHNSPDLNTLDEIFLQGHYEPPAAAADALARAASPLEVLDLGANIGLFAAYVFGSERRAHVVSVEPDTANAAIARRAIDANPTLAWELVQACATTEDGAVRFRSGLFTHSRVEVDGESDLVPAVDVFALAERCAYLKMDIEGSEWAILDDPRFESLPAKVVALEYHDHLCPSPDPRRLASDRLRQAGYEIAEPELESAATRAMVWGWRPD